MKSFYRTFLMILPGAINDIADILITLDRNRLVITNLQMIKLEALEIVKFCSNNNLEQNLPTWLDHLSSGNYKKHLYFWN